MEEEGGEDREREEERGREVGPKRGRILFSRLFFNVIGVGLERLYYVTSDYATEASERLLDSERLQGSCRTPRKWSINYIIYVLFINVSEGEGRVPSPHPTFFLSKSDIW